MRRLTRNVMIRVKTGGREAVPAGTPDTDPRTKGITNPKAWVEDGEPAADPTPPPPKKAPAKRSKKADTAATAAAAADGAKEGGDGSESEGDEGAGKPEPKPAERPADDADDAAWAAYATALGQEVPEGADKDAIVAQLDEAGLLSE